MSMSMSKKRDSTAEAEDSQHSGHGGLASMSAYAANDDNTKEESMCEVKRMDSKAAKTVWIWKAVVMTVIVVTATLVSAGSYVFLHEKENDDFHDGVSSCTVCYCIVLHDKIVWCAQLMYVRMTG